LENRKNAIKYLANLSYFDCEIVVKD